MKPLEELRHGYVTSPAVVVRVAGSPAAAVRGLRGERGWPIAQRLVELRARIASEAGALSDLLYAVISAVGDGETKAGLVAVRRAVHRVRRMDAAKLAVVPSGLRDRLDAWLALIAERDELLSALPRAVEQDWVASYDALRDAAGGASFQQGLVHANPDVFLALRKWLDTGRPAQRQTVVRLASYLARSATKTSPYSTFTSSGLAEWGTSERLVDFADRPDPVTVTEVSVGSVHRIARALVEHPAVVGNCLVRPNPSLTVWEGKACFLGARPAERLHTLAWTDAVRQVVELATPAVTLNELTAALTGDRGAAFVRKLLTLGLLEVVPLLADQSLDPLTDLLAWLRQQRPADLTRLDGMLRQLRDTLRGYPSVVDPGDRVAARDTVIRRLGAALCEVGEHSQQRNPKLAKEFVRYSFYENAVLPKAAAVLDRERWRPLLDDLDAVRLLLGLIGPDLPGKLTYASLFRSNYPAGARIPLLVFYRDVLTERASARPASPAGEQLRLPHGRFATADSPVEAVRELYWLRLASKRLLGERPPGSDGVVRVDADDVRALATEWPVWVRSPSSIAAYCQLVGSATDPELVVNNVHCGFGRGRNRVRRIMDAAGQRPDVPPEPGLVLERDGVQFAEFDLVSRSAVNVRQAGVRLAVDYPGTRGTRTQDDLVALDDLHVELGEDGLLRLVSARLGARICPVHPGLGADRLLPPAARFMIETFGESSTWFGPHTELRIGSDLRDQGDVLHLPRVAVGGVVLRRAMWMVRADRLPRRSNATTDAAWLLDVAEWLAANGIPTRCFVSVLGSAVLGHEEETEIGRNDTKPSYLDFSSMVLLLGLERRLTEPDALVQISELLPDTEDVLGDHVTEFIVELNDPGVTHG